MVPCNRHPLTLSILSYTNINIIVIYILIDIYIWLINRRLKETIIIKPNLTYGVKIWHDCTVTLNCTFVTSHLKHTCQVASKYSTSAKVILSFKKCCIILPIIDLKVIITNNLDKTLREEDNPNVCYIKSFFINLYYI